MWLTSEGPLETAGLVCGPTPYTHLLPSPTTLTYLRLTTCQEAESVGVSRDMLSGVDTVAVVQGYTELLRLQSAEALNALMNATESLLCKLQVGREW